MREVYARIFDLLSPRERRRFYILVVLVTLMGLFDVLGVASVLPFLAVVANPDTVGESRWLSWFYDVSGAQSLHGFMMILGFTVFGFVLVTTLVRAGAFYALTYFTKMRIMTLATRLMEVYLSQPYGWFLKRNSADLGKTVLQEVMMVVNGPITAAMRLLANGVMLALLVGLLFVIEPGAALGAAVLFGGTYGLIFVATRRQLTRMGRGRVDASRAQFQIVQEALGGIKAVKLMALERSYLTRFQKPAHASARHQAGVTLIAELPRQLLEVIAFGGMVLFVLWLLARRDGMIGDVLPILGVYAFAAARMFPTIQSVFSSISEIRYGKPALDQLHAELMQHRGDTLPGEAATLPAPLHLTRELVLEDVTFAFPEAERPALDRLSLTIPAHSIIGIVGSTGAGKTTLVDTILGLLTPQSGRMLVDGQEIGAGNVRAWQRSIGYVPQDIYLTDDSIAANIAFGVPANRIDMDAVIAAAKVAELHDFIVERLPEGYATPVGERGTRLSGGQRQRIGIARAVYGNPDMLVFDEATSALDNLTERAIMDAVRSLGHSKTIILIAHRLSTVRQCDVVFLLDKGRVVAADRYDGLVETNDHFRALHEATA
jgi:ABC-type multidrug transport system fused ATPase/permease subunit